MNEKIVVEKDRNDRILEDLTTKNEEIKHLNEKIKILDQQSRGKD